MTFPVIARRYPSLRDVTRHCEPAKQSRVLICIWIASFLAMTGAIVSSLRTCEAIQKPDVHLDCFVPRNDGRYCIVIAGFLHESRKSLNDF